MSYETVLLEKTDHLATLTLNRPGRLNALNDTMFEELIDALDDVAKDDDVRAMILTGAGRAFCASADVKEEPQGGDRFFSKKTFPEIYEHIRNYPQKVTLGIHHMPKPTIAAVNGLAIGDGFDFVLACDIRIGCEHARFMNAFLQMGLISNTGTSWFLPRTVGINKAFELLYTADWLEAEDALSAGVLNRLVPADKLLEETTALAHRILERPPIPNRLIKPLVFRGLNESLDAHLLSAAEVEVLTLSTEDHKEALGAFLNKRQPKFRGR